MLNDGAQEEPSTRTDVNFSAMWTRPKTQSRTLKFESCASRKFDPRGRHIPYSEALDAEMHVMHRAERVRRRTIRPAEEATAQEEKVMGI
nr:hypothetical protein CFP56_30090 [Quercus suber]